MMFKSRAILSLVALGALLSSFQNCSPTKFTSSASSEVSAVKRLADGSFLENAEGSTGDVFDKADMLFVLDESASMSTILTTLQNEFAAISGNAYPRDTLIAVTNMAPALYTGSATDSFDITKSFIPGKHIEDQPGFMKLVNAASISAFRAVSPSTTQFAVNGCASGWFTPKQANAEGISCLTAHSQVSLIGTGVEAGFVSLDQFVKTTFNEGRRTFREGTLANVIFVSDTHDPGFIYYSRPGAPTAQPKYEDVIQSIHALNPGLMGLKFHGIVPLPPAGSPESAGVMTIGDIPLTLAESKVSGELLEGFSYLSWIGKSGGVAMHPVNNAWTEAVKKMVREVSILRSPIIKTRYAIKEVLKLQVDGVKLPSSAYSIHSNRRQIQIHSSPAWGRKVSISLNYRSADAN